MSPVPPSLSSSMAAIAAHFKPALPSGGAPVSGWDFAATAWMAVAAVAVRALADATLLPALRANMAARGKGAKAARAAFENAYVVVWATLTEVLALYIVLGTDSRGNGGGHINGGCTPWRTGPCLDGWRAEHDATLNVVQKWYMIAMFQLYAHEMLGGALFGQTRLKADMVIHHVATMGLISCAYALNLNRFGIMWQALFDTSNPLLHAAKALHAAQVPGLDGVKWALFRAFAAVFFVARIAAAPFAILYPALTRSWAVLPAGWAVFLIALMLVVCGIQWVWFAKIVAMATGGGGGGGGDDADEHEEGSEDAAKKKTT